MRNCLSKTAKCLGGKSANELIHSLLNFEFLNPCCTKSIQYIRPIYTGRVKARIHGAILRAMAELHRVSIPNFVACNIARNIAAVESCPTSATLRATNFFVYPPSAAFRAIV